MDPVSLNLRLLDTLTAAIALIILLFVAYFVQVGLFNPQDISLFWENQLGLFLYDIGAVAFAIPVSYYCSRIGFFDWSASVLVGGVLGLCAFWSCSFIEGLFVDLLEDDRTFGVAFHITLSLFSIGYGIASSALFRGILIVNRPEAFDETVPPKNARLRHLFSIMILASPCVIVLNASRLVPSFN